MHSTQQQKESTFAPDRMAGSSPSPVSELRQRYARFSSGTCCLLMTQQLWPTPRRNSSHWWTASHRPVRTSDWPSVSRRRMSWYRTQKHRRSLPSTTMNSMLSASSPTSRLHHQWQPLLGRRDRQEDWEGSSTLARLTAWVWSSPKLCVKIMPVLSAHCCMAARHGLCMPGGRRLNSFHLRSIRRILVISWQYKVTNADALSRAGLPTICTPCSENAACDGWVMSAVWRMVAFQKTSSTVS